jgi:hypothetical protein
MWWLQNYRWQFKSAPCVIPVIVQLVELCFAHRRYGSSPIHCNEKEHSLVVEQRLLNRCLGSIPSARKEKEDISFKNSHGSEFDSGSSER